MDPTPGRWGPFWTPITPEAGSLFHAVQQADRRAASSGTGGNSINAARQNIRQILDNPTAARGYSEVEKALMNGIVKGTKTTNALRLGGRLSPTSGALQLMGLGAASAGLGPLGAVPSAFGYFARAAAEDLTGRQISNLSNTIRNGAPLFPSQSDARQAIIAALAGLNARER